MCVSANTSVMVWDEPHSQPLMQGQMVVSATYFKALRELRCGISCMFLFEPEAECLWSCCAQRTMQLLPEAFQDAPVTNNPASAISIRTSKGQWQRSQSQDQIGGEQDGVGRTLLSQN